MEKRYPSRVGLWFLVLLGGVPLALIVVGASALPQGKGLLLILNGLFIAGLIFVLTVPCRYTLTDTALAIRSGLLNEEIPLERITGAVKSNAVWSAPALSLRRVKVELGPDDYRLISPRDREAFIADLESRLKKAPRQ